MNLENLYFTIVNAVALFYGVQLRIFQTAASHSEIGNQLKCECHTFRTLEKPLSTLGKYLHTLYGVQLSTFQSNCFIP